ncbi:ribosomal protein S20 [Hoylesella saccharolytica F0055]|uniref:Small ribosomal subunit protein bS20 n=2 Tax=Hoylesella TaxID=2974257 RepID=L1N0L2_9BACT|nr:ribosomal protein S20 [Hoylesella saccharolytica F0055]
MCKTAEQGFDLHKITKNQRLSEKYLIKIWLLTEKAVPLHPQFRLRSLRLSVRTRDFHSLKRSSTLLGTTFKIKEYKKMANHKSSIKRIRQTKVRTLHNKYYAKTMRNAVRKLRALTDKEEAIKLYPAVQKMLDKLAKTNIIHKNKAANLKSSLAQHINKLG